LLYVLIMDSVFSLKNKNILITGASSGIGRACAIECSKAGASVYLLGRNTERLEESMKMMASNERHRPVSLELTDFAAVDEFMETLENEGTLIHGLIHSAGISTTLPLRAFNPEKLEPFIQLNVTAGIYLSRWITRKKMVPESGSSIVFLSSVMGSVGEAGKFIYSITKGAITSASKSLAIELAGKRIRVNTISPGVVETPMSGTAVYSRNESELAKIKELHPLGLGTPEDVAYAALYLLSDASRWVTGSNLFVDGGYTAR
jgi:NAD(P)-dependent dehydrogenase (short-subunit alcohol dehydrogenase family)